MPNQCDKEDKWGTLIVFSHFKSLFYRQQIHGTRLGVETTSWRLSDLSGEFVTADKKCLEL